jgi:nitroimidazol reductase NimA-like FMN-containing flavoprotein (pyridoxamine 5'-phosphate oxidase superfamily)
LKSTFEIKDEKIIDEVLQQNEYGVLAICFEDKPYSVPINFVKMDDNIYFHGGKSGRKLEILQKNQFASFSVVESYSLIQSYFSSNDGLACPATQFFKSIIIDGKIEFLEDYDEKISALDSLMKKLQKEGGYKPLSDEVYKKTINSVVMYKLIPQTTKAKFKFGQHLTQERFDMIIEHLEKRGDEKDKATIELMKKFKG